MTSDATGDSPLELSSPNLFDEVISMFRAAISTPVFENIRSLARKGKIPEEDANQILSLPLNVTDAINVVLKNKKTLINEFSHDKGIAFHVSVLDTLTKSEYEAFVNASTLIVYDDEHGESQLVYGITTSRARKEIVLSFRGSVTPKDYKESVRYRMRDIPNPVADEPSQPESVGVHHGYYSYLCEETTANDETQFDSILTQLRSLLDEHPDYRIYITGHSLGGSLAIIMTFKIASMPLIPTPVTCISFGSTRVGDLEFRRAFQVLEAKEFIRCLRVVNDGDVVPLIPFRGGKIVSHVLTGKSNSYRHVGDELRLYRDKNTYSVTHPPESSNYAEGYVKDLPNRIAHELQMPPSLLRESHIIEHHLGHEYMENICKMEDELKKLNLDDITTNRYRSS